MRTEIFYFSGTGNTLALTKKLGAKLGNTKISSIAELYGQPIKIETQIIGIAFPAYAFGLPRIVQGFVKWLEIPENVYIFALCNSGGVPGNPFRQLERLLKVKKRKLAAEFSLVMPSNYLPFGGPGTLEEQQEQFAFSESKIEEAALMIQQQKYGKLQKRSRIPCFLSNVVHKLFLSRTGKAAKKFRVNECCNSCGICVRVCPSSNIRLDENSRPEWSECCEQCMACIQWCPQKAIQICRVPERYPRYHHPKVLVSEMFLRDDPSTKRD